MRNKGLIILFLSIFYFYALGSELEITNNSNISFLYAFLDLSITTILVCLVPIIFRLKNKNLLEYGKGKKICLWNSVIWFIITVIEKVTIGYGFGVGGLGAIMFYFINKWTVVEPKPVDEDLYERENRVEENDKQVSNKNRAKGEEDNKNSGSSFMPYKD